MKEINFGDGSDDFLRGESSFVPSSRQPQDQAPVQSGFLPEGWFRDEADQPPERLDQPAAYERTGFMVNGYVIVQDPDGHQHVITPDEDDTVDSPSRPVPYSEPRHDSAVIPRLAYAEPPVPPTGGVGDAMSPDDTGHIHIDWHRSGLHEVKAAGRGDQFFSRLQGMVDSLTATPAMRTAGTPIALPAGSVGARVTTSHENNESIIVKGDQYGNKKPVKADTPAPETIGDHQRHHSSKEVASVIAHSPAARKLGKYAIVGAGSATWLYLSYKFGYQAGKDNGLLGPLGWFF